METKPFGFNAETTKQALKAGTFKIIPLPAVANQEKIVVSLITGRENILLNRPYECTPKPDYPLCNSNDDKDLTDGKISSNKWNDPAMVGFTNPAMIFFDLGKETTIDAVALRLVHNKNDHGVQFPDKIAIFSTNDQQKFMVGGYFMPEIRKGLVSEDYAFFEFSNLNLKGRYLVISTSPSLMVDEIQAFSSPEKNAADISGNLIISREQLDPLPFYPKQELYVSDIGMMFKFKKSLSGQVKITLPQEIEIVPPPLWDNCRISKVEKFKDKVEYTLDGVVGNLFVKTAGKIEKEKNLGQCVIEWRGRTQYLQVYQIKIPRVAAPKELVLTNGFTSYEMWSRWPEFPLPYICCGMNCIDTNFIDMQFLRSQPAWPAPKESRGEFYKKLKENYGLKVIVGCSFPENNTISKLSSNPKIRKFVDYRGQVKNNSICPFEYLKHSANRDHSAVIDAAVSFGSNLLFLDYEPNWYNYGESRGCCCEICREQFKEYFSKSCSDREYVDPLEIFKNTNKYAFNLEAWIKWQALAISSQIFGALQKELAPKLKETVRLGYYAVSPAGINNTRLPYANYKQLYEHGWAGIEMPYYYKITANGLWESFRQDKEAQKTGDLLIPWLSAGDGSDYGELPSEQVRYMVLEALAAGFDGLCWYTVCGFDALDWQQLALAIDEAAPAAPLIKNSRLLSADMVKVENGLARGIINNGDIYLIVADYYADAPVKVKVEVRVGPSDPVVIDCRNKELINSSFVAGKVTFTTTLDNDMMARTFLIVSNKNIGKYLVPRLFICPETVNGKIWWSPGALHAESYQVRIGRNQDLSDAGEFTVSDAQLDVSSVPLPHGKYYWQVIQTPKGIKPKFASEISPVFIK
ncbi:MAG: hypothetical protein WCV67_15060 [Victivallaceae bacterium]